MALGEGCGWDLGASCVAIHFIQVVMIPSLDALRGSVGTSAIAGVVLFSAS